MKPIYLVGLVLILFGVASSVGMAQEEWMPDPNLRQAVREALELPDDVLLTQLEMKRVTGTSRSGCR